MSEKKPGQKILAIDADPALGIIEKRSGKAPGCRARRFHSIRVRVYLDIVTG